jgi:hypothetical protein
MRRFLIRNATGEQVGEGCATSDRCWIVYQLLGDEPRLLNLRQLRFDGSGEPDAIGGAPVEWLDPEPSPYGDGEPGEVVAGVGSTDELIGFRRVPVLTREQAARLPVEGGNGGTGTQRRSYDVQLSAAVSAQVDFTEAKSGDWVARYRVENGWFRLLLLFAGSKQVECGTGLREVGLMVPDIPRVQTEHLAEVIHAAQKAFREAQQAIPEDER